MAPHPPEMIGVTHIVLLGGPPHAAETSTARRGATMTASDIQGARGAGVGIVPPPIEGVVVEEEGGVDRVATVVITAVAATTATSPLQAPPTTTATPRPGTATAVAVEEEVATAQALCLLWDLALASHPPRLGPVATLPPPPAPPPTLRTAPP